MPAYCAIRLRLMRFFRYGQRVLHAAARLRADAALLSMRGQPYARLRAMPR